MSLPRLRTLIVTISPLLRSLVVGALQPHFGIDIVDITETRDGLTARLAALAPDLVLLGLGPDEDDAAAIALLHAMPTARVLALAPDGARAWLHEMRPYRTILADLSVPALIQSLAQRHPMPPTLD